MCIQPDPELLNNFTDQIKTPDLAGLSRQQLKISGGKVLSAEPAEYLNDRVNERHKRRQERLYENSHRSHNGYSPIAFGITTAFYNLSLAIFKCQLLNKLNIFLLFIP